ncbi:aminoglycoside phosphotransferase family protein [Georgenia alba]|uniref:Aminoglycoside phosphotransferase family protein n=1 Tax=Georgenia alba TaxID=2233858 RepID=A0ABW2Q3L6_9MICO
MTQTDDAATGPDLVRTLLAEQFPQWSGLSVEQVNHYGTDHDIYRVGTELAVRLPRREWAAAQAERERVWLPRLARELPLRLPTQLAIGRPGAGYPYPWSVCDWLPGQQATWPLGECAAVDLAGFVTALRAVDTADAHPRPARARGAPLAELDDGVRRAIAELGDRIDARLALRAWQLSLDADPYHGPGVWLHGDLLAGNLLVVDGVLDAVIDWGALNVGDPACDLQPAWNLFAGAGRDRFLAELGSDESARLRGRGWVLAQTLIALPYYWDTNPGIVRQTWHALGEALAEVAGET